MSICEYVVDIKNDCCWYLTIAKVNKGYWLKNCALDGSRLHYQRHAVTTYDTVALIPIQHHVANEVKELWESLVSLKVIREINMMA